MTTDEDAVDTWGTFVRPPNRSIGAVALAGGAAVALICWYFGATPWHAATFGAVAGSLGLFYAALPDLRRVHWRDVRHARTGARHDVSSLAYALRPRYGRVRPRAVQAVRELAAARLARRHLDLTEPDDQSEIERLIGRHVYTILQPQRRWRPTYGDVVKCLDALDGLGSSEERR